MTDFDRYGGNNGYGHNTGRKFVKTNRGRDRNSYGSPAKDSVRLPRNVRERLDDEEEMIVPVEIKIATEALTRLGDFSSFEEGEIQLLPQSVGNVAKVLSSLAKYANHMSELLVRCVTHLPAQNSIVSAVIVLMHKELSTTDHRNFIVEVVAALISKLESSLSKEVDPMKAKLILRALSNIVLAAQSLGDIASLDTYGRLINSFASAGEKAVHQAGSVPSMVLMYVLAANMPWITSVLLKSGQGANIVFKLKELFGKFLQHYHSDLAPEGKDAVFFGNPFQEEATIYWDTIRQWVEQAVCISDGFLSPEKMIKSEYMGGLCEGLSLLPMNTDGSPPSLLEKSSSLLCLLDGSFFDSLSAASHDVFQPVDQAKDRDRTPSFGMVRSLAIPIFDYSDSGLTTLDRYIIADYVRDILVYFEPYVRADGTQVGEVDTVARQLLSLVRLNPLVQPAIEKQIVECLLSVLIQLPTTNSLYVQRVLLEIVRHSPTTIPGVVASGVLSLFQVMAWMNVSSSDVLAEWLALHLTNFKLSWPYWDFWGKCVNSGEFIEEVGEIDQMTVRFIYEVVSQCTKLSYPAVMEQALPERLHKCIPRQNSQLKFTILVLRVIGRIGSEDTTSKGELLGLLQGGNPTPIADENSVSLAVAVNFSEKQLLANQLYQKLLKRVDSSDVESWLDDLPSDGDDDSWKSVALLESMIALGGRTHSNILNVFDRYGELLRGYVFYNQGSQEILLSTAISIFYNNNDDSVLFFILDQLLRRNILNTNTAVTWLSQNSNSQFALSALGAPDMRFLFRALLFTIERSFDFAYAAITKKKETLSDISRLNYMIHHALDEEEDMAQDEGDGGDDDDDEEQGSRKRVRGEDEEPSRRSGEDGTAPVSYYQRKQPSNDVASLRLKLTQRSETLPEIETLIRSNIDNCKLIYSISILNVATQIRDCCSALDGGDALDSALYISLVSLFQAALGVFEGAHLHLSSMDESYGIVNKSIIQDGVDSALANAHISAQKCWSLF